MKEAFWGILIVMLGLVGIVIVNIFQNVTIGNDRTYYLLKESAEAASYDSLDLTYYRLNGDLRMVEDKFVENFTRRFAQNLGNNGNYYISVQEITGKPPRISIKVTTGITSLQGDDFGIVNRIDGILETKYKIGDITSFLEITEEEWLARTNVNGATENACNITTTGSEELECITGDLEFTGWGSDGIPETTCNAGSHGTEKRMANYRTCECGKWKDETEEVAATPINLGTEYTYNWYFHKDGEIRDIDEKSTTRAYVEKCTDAIQIYVPKDLRVEEKIADPAQYELCPASGTTVNLGQTLYWRANYIPSDSSNRNVTWSKPKEDSTITLGSANPLTDKGYSYAAIRGMKLGTTTVTATSTNGKTATCKVTVLDGNVDTVGCKDTTVTVGKDVTVESTFTPYTADKIDFTWTSSDTSIGTINKDTGVAKGVKVGQSTITVSAPNGKTGTCTLTVEADSVCKPKSSIGVYYEYDEKYCSGQYCRTNCVEWKKVAVGNMHIDPHTGECTIKRESTTTGYGEECGGTYTCVEWNYTISNSKLFENLYIIRPANEKKWNCVAKKWNPASCLIVVYGQSPIDCEFQLVCVNYQDDPKCVKTDTSDKSCDIVTKKGYTCPSGWYSSGNNCCKL